MSTEDSEIEIEILLFKLYIIFAVTLLIFYL